MTVIKCTDLADNIIYNDFLDRADVFVNKFLGNYRVGHIGDIKVIHDPVWGTIKFYPWELQVLDSPLLQRLRNINQLGLAVYTYPSAHHSRFEHTLGVTALVSKMADSINDREIKNEKAIDNEDLYKLRMAAILHDIGHCFFSHLSEIMYGNTKEFTCLKASSGIFAKAQPHEILGYIIINTPSFKNFFKTQVGYPEEVTDLFFDDLGRMIVGASIEREFCDGNVKFKKYYLTEMINGQFDADSLDYLRRDSYITGLSLTYHIDRFLYKIKLVDRKEDGVVGKHLTVAASGVSTVEEMVFGKQMLTRYIYQHQKVLATDVLVYDIVAGLRYNGKLQHPCDFLYFTDDDIFRLYSDGDNDFSAPISFAYIHADSKKTISDAVRQIKTRTLPKKALVINMGNIKSVGGKTDFEVSEAYEFLKTATAEGFRHDIMTEAVKICDKKGLDRSKIDLFDIFYSVPKPTTAKNYTDVYVAEREGFVELSEVADLNDWADEFSGRAWNAYVFSSSELLSVISLAAKKVLEDRGIEFTEGKAFSGLKFDVE
jgi:HD superfamily phosphohydrolase